MNNVESTLNLIELFASVQGETSFTGLPTTFIRLAACNLRCSWCDTTYSFGKGTPMAIAHILDRVAEFGCRHVCVTGGEPLLQANTLILLNELCDNSYVVSLETGGSLPTDQVDRRVHIILDIKCPGSDMSHKNRWSNLELIRPIDEVKFVIADRDDYEYAKEICTRYDLYRKTDHILYSPVHGHMDSQSLVAWILQDKLPVRLNLQMHKVIWTPETRGV